MPKNKNSTRYFSSKQEDYISEMLDAKRQTNSGAGLWRKGDVIHKDASLLIECKTCVKEKDSFSIKKEWINKNRDEAHTQGVYNSCVAFNFGPDTDNYFVIDEKLMKMLVEKLVEEYK